MKPTKVNIEYPIFKIVGDGGLSDPIRGEGRIFPTLIIDIGNNTEVAELFKLHKEITSGDTQVNWGRPDTFFKSNSIFLTLEFIKPMNISFGIEFDIKTQHSLIDGIIQQRGVILVSGKSGDKIFELMNKSIIVEIPQLDFDKKWNSMLEETLKDKYRKMGASRKDAKNYVQQHIKSMRNLWNIRRP